MRKKFVQIVSLALSVVLVLTVMSSAAWVDPTGQASVVGSRMMRLGIYYGSNGKTSVELKTLTGDGFQFGYYDESNNFIYQSETSSLNLTVQVDPASSFGVAVFDTATGQQLLQYDDGGMGTGLGILPISYTGAKTVVKCGYPYYGGFRFERIAGSSDVMTIVNMVSLDDYVKGVVPYEMSASWPIEALKAQAVCARTYALTRINSSHQRSYHFDLCDTTCCQAYKGVYSGSSAAQVEQAVTETSGVTVMYNGEYCETVYSSSNGGASESNVNVNGRDYPYLTGKEDPYEALIADSIPNYYWSVTFTGAELQAKLVAKGYNGCGLVTGVQTTLSPTGNVIALTFLDEYGKSYTVYRNNCRTFLSLRSMRYTVSSDGTSGVTESGSLNVNGDTELDPSAGFSVIDGTGAITDMTGGYVITANGVEELGHASGGGTSSATGTVFVFNGSGWGHNVGMSQYGAKAMAQSGYDYRQILEFYYTGVTIG